MTGTQKLLTGLVSDYMLREGVLWFPAILTDTETLWTADGERGAAPREC